MRTNCTFEIGASWGWFPWVAFVDKAGNGPGTVVVGICDGRCAIPTCNGAPDGFLGGELMVDLELRQSMMDKIFFLAHVLKDPDPSIEATPAPDVMGLNGRRKVPFFFTQEQVHWG